ncbi:MAG TPA: hypothetical protein VM534_06815 [Thermoanaerobaculia bacterium]|nr:hypothetical protein [Thermoanaerobaculia bacterium]
MRRWLIALILLTACRCASAGTDEIILQLEYEPSFTVLMTSQKPWGRVPEFTLYSNGTAIWMSEEGQRSALREADLPEEDVLALVQRVRDAGLERIDSYTDLCMRHNETEQVCVADASTGVLRFRNASGELEVRRNYATFARSSEALAAVRGILERFDWQPSHQYIGRFATLVVVDASNDASETEAHPFPLDPALLEGTDERVHWLPSDPYRLLVESLPGNVGWFRVEHAGRFYDIVLIPWVPGSDFRTEMKSSG